MSWFSKRTDAARRTRFGRRRSPVSSSQIRRVGIVVVTTAVITAGLSGSASAHPQRRGPKLTPTSHLQSQHRGAKLTPTSHLRTNNTTGGRMAKHSAPLVAARQSPTSNAYTSAVLSDSPSVYYRLDDAPGSTIPNPVPLAAHDASGHAHDGTYGPSVTSLTPGALVPGGDTDAAISNSGGTTVALTGHTGTAGLTTASARTFEVWVDSVPQNATINYAGMTVQIRNDSSGPDVQIYTDTTSVGIGITKSPADAEWNLMDVTYDGTTASVYQNGQLQGSAPLGNGAGARTDALALVNQGNYDELALYDHVLSPQSIDAHWTHGQSASPPCAPAPSPTDSYAQSVLHDGPSTYYRLDDMASAPYSRVAFDSSGHCQTTSTDLRNGAYDPSVTSLTPGALVPGGDTDPAISSPGGTTVALRGHTGTAGLTTASARTFEFWVSNASQRGSLTYGGITVDDINNSAGPEVTITSDTSSVPINITKSSAGAEWNLIDVTYDGTTVSVYQNGQLQGSAPLGNGATPRSDSLALYNQGNYDDLAIYDHVLSPDQIAAHFSESGSWLDCGVFNISVCWADASRLLQNVSDNWVGFVTSTLAPGRNPDFIYLNLSAGTGFKPGLSGDETAILTCDGSVYAELGASFGLGVGVPLGVVSVSGALGIGYVGSAGAPAGSRTQSQVDNFVSSITLNFNAGVLGNGMQLIWNPNPPPGQLGVAYWKGAVLYQSAPGASFAQQIKGPDNPNSNQPCGDIMQTNVVRSIYESTHPPVVTAGSSSTQTVAAGAAVQIVGSGFAPNSQVQLTLHSTPYFLGAPVTDSSGSFDAIGIIPNGVSGLHSIVADGQAAGGGALEVTSPVQVSSFAIVTPSVPNAVRGVPYSYQLVATGGTAPDKWKKTGTLPRGIKWVSTGLLQGVPRSHDAPGVYTFSVTVRDSTKRHHLTATSSFTIKLS
jgi:hypothetical protein